VWLQHCTGGTLSRVSNLTPIRMPELMSGNRESLDQLLAETIVANIAFVDDTGNPIVIPSAVVVHDDALIVHGSNGSRWMRRIAEGVPTCVSVTVVDGVIVARSAFESSLAYRSAVFFGSFTVLAGETKRLALDALTNRLIPGRVAEVRTSTTRELAATLVLQMPIATWSLRISDGWSEDPENDFAGDAWAGRVDFGTRPLTVRDAPDLREGITAPLSVTSLAASH
jgi:nitroimidazol reductase NimA-like FMN-containing flavoprotein (pyridoxamine 5'-phosphate oxidase superfamily)